MARITKAEAAEREAAKVELRKLIPPGALVYTVLKHVSRSGMLREISLHALVDGEMRWLTGYAARATGVRLGKRDGLMASGCGMDMGFHLVYLLSRTLYPDGFGCIGRGKPNHFCQSNDHNNGDRDYTPHSMSGSVLAKDDLAALGHWHADGGYALRHVWL